MLQVLQYVLATTYQIKNFFHVKQQIKPTTPKPNSLFSSRKEKDDLTDQGRINFQEALRKMRHDIFVMQRTVKRMSETVVLEQDCTLKDGNFK